MGVICRLCGIMLESDPEEIVAHFYEEHLDELLYVLRDLLWYGDAM